jgi:hypothetical protein
MKTFSPATGSETEWNAAYYRLEDYLRALHVVNRVHQSQIILRLLQGAAVKHAANPDLSPVTLVMQEAHAAMERWFNQIIPRGERAPVQGLTALLAANALQKWPAAFLADNVPTELQRAIQGNELRAGPELSVSSMAPRPLDARPLVALISLPSCWLKSPRDLLSRLKSS